VSKPEITVIYPLIDVRGQASDRVRSWTQQQALARDRFRVIVVSDGKEPSQDQGVREVLAPSDELVHIANGGDAEMWNFGASLANTSWLMFVEGHSTARPGCLEAVCKWTTSSPPTVAGNVDTHHRDDTIMARLSDRWFGLIHQRWRSPGEWARIHRAGFVIRADAFRRLGGFEGEYGQFSAPLLSARIHSGGDTIASIPGAAVVHQDDERMRDHHFDTADHVRGECDARARVDAIFFERFFGHWPIWTNQLSYRPAIAGAMTRALLATALAHPVRLYEMVPSLPARLGQLLLPLGPRIALNRLAVALDEFAVERLPIPAAWQWSRFLRAHARVVYLTQLEWIRGRMNSLSAPAATDRLPVEHLGPEAIVGMHALETHGGRRLRWSEPVLLLHLVLPEQGCELRIETGNVRGNPLDYVISVYVGGRKLPRAMLASDDDGTLVLSVPASFAASAAKGIVLVCSPFCPIRRGLPNRRRLGMPVMSIGCVPLSGATRMTSVAA
jgi:hypothetical protein